MSPSPRRCRPSPRSPPATSSTSTDGCGHRPDDDPYGDYLRRSGARRQPRRAYAHDPRQAASGNLQSLRDASGDALQLALPEPEAGLAAGILVGLRERVDRSLAADFATAGVSHVVAISGWNIAIVAASSGR